MANVALRPPVDIQQLIVRATVFDISYSGPKHGVYVPQRAN